METNFPVRHEPRDVVACYGAALMAILQDATMRFVVQGLSHMRVRMLCMTACVHHQQFRGRGRVGDEVMKHKLRLGVLLKPNAIGDSGWAEFDVGYSLIQSPLQLPTSPPVQRAKLRRMRFHCSMKIKVGSASSLQYNRVINASAAPKHTPHRVFALPLCLNRASIGQLAPGIHVPGLSCLGQARHGSWKL